MESSIFDRVRKLRLSKGEYAVIGSGVLEAYGIRPAQDVDLVASPRLFVELLNNGWELEELPDKKRLKKDNVEVLSEFRWYDTYIGDTEELIQHADIIKGIPFLKLEEVLKWKKAAGREKDIKDVELIEEFLQARKGSKT